MKTFKNKMEENGWEWSISLFEMFATDLVDEFVNPIDLCGLGLPGFEPKGTQIAFDLLIIEPPLAEAREPLILLVQLPLQLLDQPVSPAGPGELELDGQFPDFLLELLVLVPELEVVVVEGLDPERGLFQPQLEVSQLGLLLLELGCPPLQLRGQRQHLLVVPHVQLADVLLQVYQGLVLAAVLLLQLFY
jgi:hypothetical protein